MRVLVTGIGRSGTKYMSEVLTRCGLRCTHEGFVRSSSVSAPVLPPDVAESSWQAAVFLGKWKVPMVVVHQVRDPLQWLSSWVDTVWGADPPPMAVSFLSRCSGVNWIKEKKRDPVGSAMRLWSLWNSLIEPYAIRRYRVEDVDCELVSWILKAADKKPNAARIEGVLRRVSKKTNARPKTSVFDWKSLPDVRGRDAFVARAIRYGYQAEEK